MDNPGVRDNFANSYANLVSIQPVHETLAGGFQQPVLMPATKAGDQSQKPLSIYFNLILKRGIDIIVAVFLIVFFLSWCILIIALLIKIDSKGPVFFLQKRIKKGGKMFTCFKFRSMVVNSDAHMIAACKNDARITRVGRFLRDNHLDELPQLVNVLIGDMSLIGPRPYMLRENEKFRNMIKEYPMRNLVKPGITGLAQSKGYHGSIQDISHVKERVALDLQYIDRWSLAMDAQIFFDTLKMLIRPKQKSRHPRKYVII